MDIIRKLFAALLLFIGAVVMIGGGGCAVTVGFGLFGGHLVDIAPIVGIALVVAAIGLVLWRAGRSLWRVGGEPASRNETPPAP